ncbi:hypothetical protein [Roseovarius sp. MMSF_3350]|uniref:hypothetical protein n=1 Tax=Roseovarius sp. MMSF_3350 TaxID=3046706 RepID=UPI00273EDD67|nr:hypothetical protein [Roseovarius sp. MMSF_3350]
MADRIILARATDDNGDIVAGALAYFYEAGTTTPLEVYSDSAGTVAVSQPLTADATGTFAATFATQNVKVDVQDTEGASLPGFPSDPHPTVPTSAGGASLVSFDPTVAIPDTNVQDAIEQVQENLEGQLASPALTGTPTAPTATVGTNTTQLATTAFVLNQVLDEDDFATDSATRPPSQQSTKALFDTLSVIPSAVIEERRADGSDPTAVTADTWTKRAIATEAYDPDGVVSISSNEFTFTSDGWVNWTAPGRDSFQTRLYNVTDSSVTAQGSSVLTAGGTVAHSHGGCAVVSGKTYRLEQNTSGTSFGRAASRGGGEVYARVTFWAS